MAVKDFNKYQKLASIISTTFNKLVKSNTESVMMRVVDEEMISATFIMVVNFGSAESLRQMTPRYKNEAMSMIKAALDRLKEEYKEQTGKSISLKIREGTEVDSVEWLSYQIYNPKKTAYYRVTCVIDVT